jgi:hypothetical protein
VTAAVLIDEVGHAGGRLWLENNQIHVTLPPEADWLLEELRAHKAAVLAECRSRWLRPGIPYAQWVRTRRTQ